ncbi:MAG: fasciclin domain-containing protein [Actinomycetes bacterium]
MMLRNKRTIALAAAGVTMALSMTACGGSSGGSTTAGSDTSSSAAPSGSAPQTSASMAADAFGSACSAVPASGAGSFDGMATAPVASAAAANPVLSTLVTAVKKAGLVDTLNSAKDITVLAPSNDAFAAMDKATLNKAMGDPKGLLTKVLTYHVLAGKIAPDQLAGTHKSLEGGSVTIEGSGENFKVDGNASVICGNVQTANATVYIIDRVLSPKM